MRRIILSCLLTCQSLIPDVRQRPNIFRILTWLQTLLSIYTQVLAGLSLYLDFSVHTSKIVCSPHKIVGKSANTVCCLKLWNGAAAVTDFAVDTGFSCPVDLFISLWCSEKAQSVPLDELGLGERWRREGRAARLLASCWWWTGDSFCCEQPGFTFCFLPDWNHVIFSA